MHKTYQILLRALLVFYPLSGISQSNQSIETVLQRGHVRYVTCVAYSPDGKYLVTGSVDNTIKLWNAGNGKEIRTFSMHTNNIRSVEFSPDGTKLLSAGADNKAFVHTISNGKVLVEIAYDKRRLFKACYSPDGSRILTMDDRTEVAVWNALTGEKEKVLKKDYNSVISTQWFSSNGGKLLSLGDSQKSYLTDFIDSSNSKTLIVEGAYDYAFSSDNKYIAIGTTRKNAVIFNAETGEKLHVLDADKDKKCQGCKTHISFSHSGKMLVSAAKYSGVVVWDVRKGTEIRSFEYEDDWIDKVIFSPDDKNIMLTADDETVVWNIKTGNEVLKLSYNGLECIPVFSPDSKYLLTTNKNNAAALWNLNIGRTTRLFEGYLNRERTDGMKFKQGNWYHSNILRYLSLKSAISLHPNGTMVFKGKIDSMAIMLNLETGNIEQTFKGHKKSILCSDFSKDGNWLITGSGDRTLRLWEVETGKQIKMFEGHQELVFDVKFSSDDKYLVSGSWDGTMRIWNVQSGKMLRTVQMENASPFCVNFTPNDLYTVTGDLANKLKLWEFDAGKEFRDVIGHTNVVADMSYSPNGKSMVTASLDGKVKVWDLLSGMLISKFSRHESGVYSVKWHPSGKYIISGSNDRTIKIWDPETGKEIVTLTGHSGGINSLQITADGEVLISCSVDGEIKIWDLVSFKERYTYIQIDRDNWLAKTPEGYFDGSANAIKHINYVSGLEVISVGSLFEKYYSPNLIRRINGGEEFSTSKASLKSLIQTTPTVQLSILPTVGNEIISTDSVVWFKNSISLNAQITDQGGGVDELRVYHNGKLIQNEKYHGTTSRSGKNYNSSFEVPVITGKNEFTAVAFSKDRTESQPITVNVQYDGIETDANLYILSIGINKYLNPAYALSYANEDAKAYTKMIKKSAGAIFNSIEEFFLKDNQAEKTNIQQVFTDIASKAGPEDVFIFYFAGHGAVDANNGNESSEFYIIPHNVTNIYGDTEMLKEKAISSEEILNLSKQIQARKQMFVLDACQSGGALTAFNSRGANREKAIAQLARSTGTFFLLASGAIQYASEAKDLGHGIFTYALLEGLGGKADGGLLDKKITANELKSYVEDRVPELTEEYMLTPQYPTGYSFGQDFPIVIVR